MPLEQARTRVGGAHRTARSIEMKLRIIAGELAGRYIEAPAGCRTRPTPERVREAWFSALGDRVVDARVLELFAGSGALGIEALSRGAATVHFVESNRRAAATLRRNLERLGLSGRADTWTVDVFRFLRRVRRDEARSPRFDIALADPPYAGGGAGRLAGAYRRRPFADLLCIEHAPGVLDPGGDVVWERRYGDTVLTFLAVSGAPGQAVSGAPGQAVSVDQVTRPVKKRSR